MGQSLGEESQGGFLMRNKKAKSPVFTEAWMKKNPNHPLVKATNLVIKYSLPRRLVFFSHNGFTKTEYYMDNMQTGVILSELVEETYQIQTENQKINFDTACEYLLARIVAERMKGNEIGESLILEFGHMESVRLISTPMVASMVDTNYP
jgi:hypothetical protein